MPSRRKASADFEEHRYGRAHRERPEHRSLRFQRLERTRCEIHVNGVAPMVLARAVPEMSLRSVSDVVALDGELPGDAVLTVVRRLELLGGTILEVLREDR